METIKAGPFLGINNRLPDFALGTKEGTWLREANNVDIDNSGSVRRRDGVTLTQAMTGAHSLSPDARYVVRANVLYAITLPAYSESMVKLLSSDAPVSWVAYGDWLFYSNGTDSGKLCNGTHYPLALPTPAAPAGSATSGALDRGAYQVSVSYVNSTTGEEGGVSPSSSVTVANSAGITVTLPSTVSGATHINVYVSFANGEVPMLCATVAVGTTTHTITSKPAGREANQRSEAPLPAGQLFMFNGVLCSFSGKNVYEGLPFRPGYYLPSKGRIPFVGDVTIAAPSQNGVYVAADKTYWLAGKVMSEAETVVVVLPYGAVPRTAFKVPHTKQVGWFGDKGFVVGDEQGQVSAMMQDSVDVTVSGTTCVGVFETRGYRRAVAMGYCMNLETGAVSTYADFAFTSINGGYGTKADGIYAMTGTQAVDAHIGLGKINFGSENLKHLPACYIGAASTTPMELHVTTPDAEDYRYTARSYSDDLRVHRVDPGKGLRANWYDLSIHNTNGSDFTLASVSFAPVASGRRI